MSVSASEARRNLFPLLRQVNDDRTAIEITSSGGNAYLVSAADWESIVETLYLGRSHKMTARIMKGLGDAKAGRFEQRELIEE